MPFLRTLLGREGDRVMLATDVYKLLDGTAEAAFVVTVESEICFWNAAAERLFGYPAADVLNRTCNEVIHGKSALGASVCTGEHSVQHCAARGETIPAFDLQVTTRSGQRKWINVSTILFEDSRLHRFLIVHLSHDISKQKEAERLFSKITALSKQVASIGESQPLLAPVVSLSDQERRILTLFAEAKNSGQVARELRITLPTLRNHLHAINQKLRTHNRLEAVLHAMKRGLI